MSVNPPIINGKVQIAGNNTPLPLARVELWGTEDAVSVWIASSNADQGGNFSFSFPTMPVAPEYKVFVNNQLVLTQSTSSTSVTLQVPENVLDSVLTDNTNTDEKVTYIQVQGTVTDAYGVPATDVTINIHELGYHANYLLATVLPNVNGQYSAKISTKFINNSIVIAGRMLYVEAVDTTGTSVGTSGNISNWQDIIVVNLTTSHTPPSKYENILSTVQKVAINNSSLLLTTSNVSTTDIGYLSTATGRDQAEIIKLANAQAHNTISGLDTDKMYVFSSSAANEPHPLLNARPTTIGPALTTASNNNVIPALDQGEINTFVGSAKAYQVDTTPTIGIQQEPHTLNTVLSTLFSSSSGAQDINNFLTVYNSAEYSNPVSFWDSYSDLYGATKAKNAQQGLQLAAITGFQPQIMAYLLPSVTESHIGLLATNSLSDWQGIVSAVCTATGQLCVPASIRGNNTDPGNIAIQHQYAEQLYTIAKNAYPLTSINGNLQGPNGYQLIPNDPDLTSSYARTQVINFIANNPGFDLRINSIHDIVASRAGLNTDSIDVATVAKTLAPFQTMLRITGGKPDAVVSMMANTGSNTTVTSAAQITAMGQDQFTAAYASALGGTTAAAAAYSRASFINTAATTHLVDNIQNITSAYPALAGSPVFPVYSPIADPNAHPDLVTLFGSLSFCSCDQCMSMYSPAAYLTDILNFLPDNLYNELVRRRPDIPHIDLTCKNTNTAIPYIDLVNELLELTILRLDHIHLNPNHPDSFQTSGTQTQLAAFPEHVYNDGTGNYLDFSGLNYVYSSGGYLPQSPYPYNLPFILGVEETRTYLPYFGTTRLSLMRMFAPYYYSSSGSLIEITQFVTFIESIGLNYDHANIVGTLSNWNNWSTCAFYGFPSETLTNWPDPANPSNPSGGLSGAWNDLLSNHIDLLIQQTQISYNDLLTFLNTDFLTAIDPDPMLPAGTRNIRVVNKTGADSETCALNELQLKFTGGATSLALFAKLHRFIRLWRAGSLTIYQWDILLRSLSLSDIDDSVVTQMQILAQAYDLAVRLNITPEQMATWWSNIDTRQYTDYNSGSLNLLPSIYDTVFNNKGVVNDPTYNQVFNKFGNVSSAPYLGNTAHIANSCRLNENDVKSILTYLGIAWQNTSTMMSLTVLSKIYLFSQLTSSFAVTVSDLIVILQLSGTSIPMSYPPAGGITYPTLLNNLETLITTVQAIKDSGFSVSELNYLTANIDTASTFEPDPMAIELFYEGLRSELQKYPNYTSSPSAQLLNQLTNVIYQYYSKQFGIASNWVKLILDPAGVSSGFTLTLIGNSFVGDPAYPQTFNAIVDRIRHPLLLCDIPIDKQNCVCCQQVTVKK